MTALILALANRNADSFNQSHSANNHWNAVKCTREPSMIYRNKDEPEY